VQAKIDVNDLDISTLVLSAVLSAINTSLQELVVFLLVSSFLTFLVDLRLCSVGALLMLGLGFACILLPCTWIAL